ncbi:MAG TPA: ABC transporter substrate-binding protein [Pseudolabrys sp.]|nr:ABC transporter substrate-binding protein [Pseudolabrys sp.]
MTAQETPDTLWYTRCPVPTPLGIAGQLGWLDAAFEPDGITIKSVKESGDPKIMLSHYDHHLSWSFRQGGSIPPLWTRARGRETRLLGLTWGDEFQAIITLPQTGIRNVHDLKGKRFGVPKRCDGVVDFPRGTALKGLVSALAIEGLKHDILTIVDIKDDDAPGLVPVGDPRLFGLKRRFGYFREVEALVKGEVDAIFVKGPQGIAIANFLAAHVVSEFGFHPDPRIRINAGTPRTLTIDATFADKRPDLVDRLVSQVVKAGEWAAQNRDQLLRTIASESNATEGAVIAALGEKFHLGFDLRLDAAWIDALDQFKAFLLEWGVIEADFDLQSWVDPAPLRRVLERKAAA